MQTVLITGASRGIGLEFARQYAAEGWRVIATVRHPERAVETARIKGEVEIRTLDVTDLRAVAALGRDLAHEAVDVLIANAGVSLVRGMAATAIDEAAWVESIRVNTIGPLAIAGAMLEPVRRGAGKRLIAISSRMGSIRENKKGGSYAYRSSKAALNTVWKSLAAENRDLIVTLLDPGWVKSDMGGERAPLEVADSVSAMRRVIARLKRRHSGRFYSYDGWRIPW